MLRNPTRVFLTGFGSVGRSLAQILAERPDLPIVISGVADRGGFVVNPAGLIAAELLEAKAAGSVASHLLGQNGVVSLDDISGSDAEVLLELASTNYEDGQPGWEYIQAAFANHMDVVLASKGPLVAHWDELFAAAVAAGRRVRYSATHGAPLPALDMVRFGLAGSHVHDIRALLNSTSGIILEAMEKGLTLDEAVAEVARMGVAETNPRLDIEGWDAAAKCMIIGRSIYGGAVKLDSVKRVGVEKLRTADVVEAARRHTPVKLLCKITPTEDGFAASVAPALLQPNDPLSQLREGALGVVYEADPMGRLFLAGYGAGGRPTAAAVIRDVLLLANDYGRGESG